MNAAAPAAAPAIVALTARGFETARAIAGALPGAKTHGLARRIAGADVEFDNAGDHLRALFEAGAPVVGVCAAGILVRALAPVLGDKTREPPVIAVSEDGAHVVPLLGGHHGANDMARHIAQAIGGAAAVTTAGDGRLGFALDDAPAGWRIADPGKAKAVTAALLAGEAVRLDNECPGVDAAWLVDQVTFDAAGEQSILITPRLPTRAGGVTLHPGVLALGVGCERGTEPGELIELVRTTLAENNLAAEAIACVVSLDLKSDEPAVQALASELGVPARFFDAAALEAQTPHLATPSDVVFAEVGCHGVSEGAALAAAGPGHDLIVAKQKSARATCALALAGAIIDPAAVGRARGRLAIVGIGPGGAAMRTPEADAAVAGASDIIGYSLYIDLLGAAVAGKKRHDFDLGEEEARVRAALDLAAQGRDVALVCSGDAGIYAMASPAFELIERERAAKPEWARLDITVVPGVSALQTAAARAGAPLGHDFCAISLSDLLTPWTVIENRVRAAAAGDFVVAFYNPVSKRRTTQLAKARDILLEHRPHATPVMLARKLGRTGESLTVITLGELDPANVDMLTVVLVGSSASRRIDHGGGTWVYTPRGYAAKLGDQS
jgi:cobalt-precorrin 5A hydrolase/precorrin-3B C17-methyltransferase